MKMSKFEKKYGRYAIENLTVLLIMCYVAGYIIQIALPDAVYWITLNPYLILKGQVWRLFTWLLMPPDSLGIFTILVLYFYYSIGTVLERTWGTYRYNVFLFGGILLTILASFLSMGCFYLLEGNVPPVIAEEFFALSSVHFSTFYISTSIFLGFAMTYPESEVYLMFVIPVRVKWIGMIDLGAMILMFVTGDLFMRFAVGAALLNILLFYLSTKNLIRYAPKQMKRRSDFKREVKKSNADTRHKCAICGRTEEDEPELEFRYCSKCNGNYEYCQHHLFTHEHVK